MLNKTHGFLESISLVTSVKRTYRWCDCAKDKWVGGGGGGGGTGRRDDLWSNSISAKQQSETAEIKTASQNHQHHQRTIWQFGGGGVFFPHEDTFHWKRARDDLWSSIVNADETNSSPRLPRQRLLHKIINIISKPFDSFAHKDSNITFHRKRASGREPTWHTRPLLGQRPTKEEKQQQQQRLHSLEAEGSQSSPEMMKHWGSLCHIALLSDAGTQFGNQLKTKSEACVF